VKNITILGSTGSIGVNTLDVIAQHPDRFRVIALTAHKNIDLLFAQCVKHQPKYAVISNDKLAIDLTNRLKTICPTTQVLSKTEGLEYVASLSEVDTVMASLVGAAGLLPTLAAVRAGKCVLLANKEVLVMSGQLFMNEIKNSKAVLLPIDSEHNAIFQCLATNANSDFSAGVKKIIITASGGAFRDVPLEQLPYVKPEQACTHPNWNMGQKITVDCATMMNKGFEVIEAHWLFGVPLNQIEAVLHPQSIIHSFVEYIDGSMLAQLGNPDMRIPIAYALGWPERIGNGVKSLDLLSVAQLNFAPMDLQRYPCFDLAYQAMKVGGTASAILNAANEIAVEAFLAKKIAFTDIAKINEQILNNIPSQAGLSLEVILEDDLKARKAARQIVDRAMVSSAMVV